MREVSRRYDAIIFDLYGTLVDNMISMQDYQCLAETARALGADTTAFIRCWANDVFRTQRHTGAFLTPTAEVEQVCRLLDISVTPNQVENAVQALRTHYGLSALTPRPGVIETLAAVKHRGFALGLISNCSYVVTDVWEQSAFAGKFDATIFSCIVGARKSDPRLYQAACEGLGLAPERCLYIGDGDGRELTGARQFGMDAVLICAPHEREVVMKRDDPRQWDGPVIEQIEEVLAYLDGMECSMNRIQVY